MKRNNISFGTLFLSVICSCALFGQDNSKALKAPAVYNHYHLNPFLINPANTGFDNKGTLVLNFRNQWAGFPGAPKVLTFGINATAAPNMGLGAIVYAENYGVSNRFIAQGNYAYHFRINETTKFGLGLAGSYNRYSLDNEALTDGFHDPNDKAIDDAINGIEYFGADLGFWGEINGKWRVGLSLPHLIQTRLDNKKYEGDKSISFLAFVGGVWQLPEYRLVLEPSVLIRKIGDVPFGVDANILAKLLEERLFGGITYSYGPSWHRVGFLAGVRVDKLRIFYSYDQSYLGFQDFNNGSHELTLSFDIFKSKEKPKAEMNVDPKESMPK